jgi:glycine oxidase
VPGWDLIVVGAGIIGLSAAFEAAASGLRVLVVERAGPATGASGVAAGMLAPMAEAHDMPLDLCRIGVASAVLLPDLVSRVESYGGGAGYQRAGTLLVAGDRDQAGDLAQLERSHTALGVPAVRLTTREVLGREPRVSPRNAGGLWCPDDHAIDPVAFCRAMVLALRVLGSEVRTGVPVDGILGEEAVRGVRLGDSSEERAPRVLVAAGLGSPDLVERWVDLRMRPVKGEVLHLRGEALITSVVRTPRVYLVPRGEVLVVGASSEELGDHARPLAGVTMDLLYEAWRVLPGIYDLELDRIIVGHRPATDDGRPVVGPAGPDGLFIATGHHRHGILLAAWTARRVLADLGLAEAPEPANIG